MYRGTRRKGGVIDLEIDENEMSDPSYREQLRFFKEIEAKDYDKELALKAQSRWEAWLKNPALGPEELIQPFPVLSSTFRRWRLLEPAWDLCDQTLKTFETRFARERSFYARILNERGEIEFLSGKVFDAEKTFREALRIRLEEPDVSWEEGSESHNNLALLMKTRGKYRLAEKHYQKALRLRKAHAQDNPILYAQSLNNLALLYRMMGHFEEADPLYHQSLQLRRKALGADHPTVLETENNIGLMDLYLGRFESARERFLNLLQRQNEEHLLPTPVLAQTQTNLAGLYLRLEEHKKAFDLFCDAEESCKRVFGESHFHVLQILINRAFCLICLQKLAQAEALLQAVIPECESRLGFDHLITLTAKIHLGRLFILLGNHLLAERVLSECSENVKGRWGQTHPLFCEALHLLGIVQSITHQWELALETLYQSCARQTEVLVRIARAFPESFTFGYLKTLQMHTAVFFSFIEQFMPDSAKAANLGFQIALQRKAVAYEASFTSQERMLAHTYPGTRVLFDKLKATRVELAQRTLGEWGPKEAPEVQHARMKKLESEIDQLEAEIYRQIPRKISSFFPLEEVTTTSIQEGLADEEVLVDFLSYPFFELTEKGAVEKEDRYIAFVLRKQQEEMNMVVLGPAQTIDRKIQQFRSSISMGLSIQGGGGERFSDSSIYLQSHGRQLYQKLFQPLLEKRNELSSPEVACSWVLSPDGLLNLLPFESLIMPDGSFMIENCMVRYITTPRELLSVESRTQSPSSRKALLFANPAFSLPVDESQNEFEESNPLLRAFRENDVFFEPLSGTEEEIQQIMELLEEKKIPATTFSGRKATKKNLLSVRSPWILHIATHGFFLQRRASSVEGDSSHHIDTLPPSFRSGMVLSGINNLIEGKRLQNVFQSPILTSYDIFGIDLFATELVALSACETGLGEIENGEGVMGLRRAFLTAGAKTLMASLWKVSDSSTHRLMRDFYKNLFSGMTKSQSLRNAQLSLIHEMREHGQYPSPWEWAGFICIGHHGALYPSSDEVEHKN